MISGHMSHMPNGSNTPQSLQISRRLLCSFMIYSTLKILSAKKTEKGDLNIGHSNTQKYIKELETCNYNCFLFTLKTLFHIYISRDTYL